MLASPDHSSRVALAATAAFVLLLLGVVAVSGVDAAGSEVQLQQLKAATDSPARPKSASSPTVALVRAFTRFQVPRLFIAAGWGRHCQC